MLDPEIASNPGENDGSACSGGCGLPACPSRGRGSTHSSRPRAMAPPMSGVTCWKRTKPILSTASRSWSNHWLSCARSSISTRVVYPVRRKSSDWSRRPAGTARAVRPRQTPDGGTIAGLAGRDRARRSPTIEAARLRVANWNATTGADIRNRWPTLTQHGAGRASCHSWWSQSSAHIPLCRPRQRIPDPALVPSTARGSKRHQWRVGGRFRIPASSQPVLLPRSRLTRPGMELVHSR